jgi:pimeloyl-ACP methyl ester carboxylesterase
MRPRQIHVIHRPASKKADAPDLVFVHGGYMDSRCWDIHFLPHFSALGHDCHALDLSGHGLSEGKDAPDEFGIDEFADDLRQLIASLPGDAVLIGHSMGCAVIERVLERSTARAAILMAPVPPTGTQGSIMRLALKHPELFTEIARISQGRLGPNSLSLMRDVYFSPVTEPEELLEFAHLIQPESERAISDMLMLGTRLHRARARLPVLVIGGQCDAVFPPSAIAFTAVRWHAPHKRIPNCGHMLMLEHQWRTVADAVTHWLASACHRQANA